MLMKTHANAFQLHFYFMINIANVVNTGQENPSHCSSMSQGRNKNPIFLQKQILARMITRLPLTHFQKQELL